MIEFGGMDMTEIDRFIAGALSPEAVDRMVQNVAEAARAEWIRLAGDELFTSRRDYINSIQRVVRRGASEYIISLVGQPAVGIEEGFPRTDLRDTLLGPNVPVVEPGSGGKGKRQSKDGNYYRAIPFRHGTPTSGGGAGQPMGRAYRAHEAIDDARALGKQVYAQAKALTKTPYGGSPTSRLPNPVYTGKSGKSIPVPKLKPHHSTSIYTGMVRTPRSPGGRERGTQFTTFRTISTGVKTGWIRPATPGKRLSSRVSEFVSRLAPQTIEAYVEGLK